MNLLAHAVLSPEDPLVLLGNFSMDFLGRSEVAGLDPRIQEGTRLHREIDRFTDRHPLVEEAKGRLVGYQRFSNALVDIFFDHFLAIHWNESASLETFISSTYSLIGEHRGLLPESAAGILGNVVETDWLSRYSTVEGLEYTLTRVEKRIAYRTGREYELTGSLSILVDQFDEFERIFLEFWPELQGHVRSIQINR